MANTNGPSEKRLKHHFAVRMKDCIIVLDNYVGYEEDMLLTYIIYVCNLWTEQWRKYETRVPQGKRVPYLIDYSAVAVESDIFIFEGYNPRNERCGMWDVQWRLTKRTDGSFTWRTNHIQDITKTPSPRSGQCAWAYDRKVWIFGGFGPSPEGFLYDYGDFQQSLTLAVGIGLNNQLLCYDPSINSWTNMECFGEIPSPRKHTRTAIIKEKVWLHGKTNQRHRKFHAIRWHELNMHSLVWTHIDISMSWQEGLNNRHVSRRPSITPISNSELALYVGYNRVHECTFTWILDVESHTWGLHMDETENQARWGSNHTGTPGLNNNVILLGGKSSSQETNNSMFSVMLEPKLLQQLALKTIYQHKKVLEWKGLPRKLIHKMMGNEAVEEMDLQ